MNMLTIKQRIPDFIALMRLDRPIGILLLLWPTLWALWIAGEGAPSVKNVLIFTLGVIVMRTAGCVINDFADRNLDAHISRTQNRPLATGKITSKEALALFIALGLIALALVLFLNVLTIYLSFVALALAITYPFMKRYTYMPQVVLGAAFSCAIPMAFAAEQNQLPAIAWLIYTANLIWTVAYDTQYAMVDRQDDIKIGIKSTAILFGNGDRIAIGLLQGITIISLILIGRQLHFTWPWHVGLLLASGLFIYQQWLTKAQQPEDCFKAFLNNNWVGLVIFAGLLAQYQL